ncbi:MAG: hypothetical protein AAFN78_10255 [Pseudomonadota bacterium]
MRREKTDGWEPASLAPAATSLIACAVATLATLLAVPAAPALADEDTASDAGQQEGDDAQPENRWATPRYPGARVFIDAAGGVFVDDEPATAELLHEAFTGLKRFNGVLWYARENPSTEPEGKVAEAVDQVIGILRDYRLAVELFEAGFPDPDEHWETLENPPPRYKAPSASAKTEKAER